MFKLILTFFYKLVFNLVNFLYTICEKFEFLFYSNFFFQYFPFEKKKIGHEDQKKMEIILKKSPQHLTVILGREKPNFPDLVNLIFWCLKHEIFYLSFYDANGILKKNEEKLKNCIKLKKFNNNNITIIWHHHHSANATNSKKEEEEDPLQEIEKKKKNGCHLYNNNNGIIQKISAKTKKQLNLKILGPLDDAKSHLAYTLQNLLQKNEKILDLDFQQISLVDKKFPEPNLAIICGKFLQFYEFPTWQLRQTEILTLRSHVNLKYSEFFKLLHTYSLREQRMGK